MVLFSCKKVNSQNITFGKEQKSLDTVAHFAANINCVSWYGNRTGRVCLVYSNFTPSGISGAIVEEQAADSIRATLEDYRKYGLICRFSKEERETLVYFFFAHLILSGMIGYELYKQPSVTRIVFVALFLSTGLLFIYLWYQDNQIAKQLARLKGKK